MDRAEKCFFCGSTSPEADLVAWFVQDERRRTHSTCWLEAYRSNRASPVTPAPRKTLDDIRRELEAEYPAEAKTAETPVPVAAYLNGDAGVVERHRAASRRRARRRRYALVAAVGGLAALVLLAVISVAVSRETIRPGAVASAPEVLEADADRTSAITSAGSLTSDEPVPVVLPALLTELDQQLKALRSDFQTLAARQDRSDSRIAGMDSRVRGVESSMRRLADDVASAAATRAASAAATRAAERSVAVSRQTTRKPVPGVPLPPTPAPVAVADSERWTAATPDDVRPVAQAVPATTDVVATGAPAVSDSAPSSSVPPTLREKLRADWRAIKQGFASAGDDFKASMREFGLR